MAGIVTWRNVDTPNFGASNALMRDAQEQITGSMEKLGQVAKDYGQDLEQRNTADMVAELRKYGTSKELNAAVANGEFSVGVLNKRGVNVDQFQQKLDARLLKMTEQEDHDTDRIALAQQRDDAHAVAESGLLTDQESRLTQQKNREVSDSDIARNHASVAASAASAAADRLRQRVGELQLQDAQMTFEGKVNAKADAEALNAQQAENTTTPIDSNFVTQQEEATRKIYDTKFHNSGIKAKAQQELLGTYGTAFDQTPDVVAQQKNLNRREKDLAGFQDPAKHFVFSDGSKTPEQAVYEYAKNVSLDPNSSMLPWQGGNLDEIVDTVAKLTKAEAPTYDKNGKLTSGRIDSKITHDLVLRAMQKVGTQQGEMNPVDFERALVDVQKQYEAAQLASQIHADNVLKLNEEKATLAKSRSKYQADAYNNWLKTTLKSSIK